MRHRCSRNFSPLPLSSVPHDRRVIPGNPSNLESNAVLFPRDPDDGRAEDYVTRCAFLIELLPFFPPRQPILDPFPLIVPRPILSCDSRPLPEADLS